MNDKITPSNEAHEDSLLNKSVTIRLLLSFGLPTMVAMLVMNTFVIVDGVFAMRRLGDMSMAAITAVNPLAMLVMAIGILFAMGGSALVVKKEGMGLYKEARQNFTLLTILATGISILVSAFVLIFPEATLNLLGVNYEFMEYAERYLSILAFSIPLVVVSQMFNQFIIADGRPMLGMGISLIGSVVSAGLNALFLFGFNWEIEALAWATLIGYTVPVAVGFNFFCWNRKGTLYFAFPKWNIKAIGTSVLNGAGGAIGTLAMAAIIIVLNNVVVRMEGVGALGVAVAGMVMGIHATIASVFNGYLAGVAPLISFNHGNAHHSRQRRLFRYNLKTLAIISAIVVAGVLIFSDLLIRIYVPSGTEIHEMAMRGLRIASLSFVFLGFNTFAGGQFVALNKGLLGGFLILFRLVGLNLTFLLTLPRVFDLTGVWLSWPLTEGLAIVLSLFLLLKMGKKYGYR